MSPKDTVAQPLYLTQYRIREARRLLGKPIY